MQVQTTAIHSLLRRYFTDIANTWPNAGAQSTIDEVLSPEIVFHAPNDSAGQRGLERHRAFLNWHHTAFPDQRFEIDDVVVADDRAACRWTLTGTHGGPFLGVEATGRAIEVSGIDFFHIAGEHISELWRSFDLRGLLKQLDPPEAPSA